MNTTSMASQPHQIARIEAWLKERQGEKPPLTCALCGKTEWESAEAVHVPSGSGFWPEGSKYVVLSCGCGYSVFIKASAMKLPASR